MPKTKNSSLNEKQLQEEINQLYKLGLTQIIKHLPPWLKQEKEPEITTILGNKVKPETRGILYLCKYDYENNTLTVMAEHQFIKAFDALDSYANTRNPESQLVTGQTYEKLIDNLNYLHRQMQNPEWLQSLGESL